MPTNLQLALKALLRNRVQALLTLSGMSFGVAMVVIVSGLGRGAQLRIESQIEAAGPTLITIRSGNLRPSAIVTSGEQDTSGGEVSEGALPAVGIDGTQDVVGNAAVDDARRRAIAPKMTRYRSPPTPLAAAETQMLSTIPGIKTVAASVEGNITLDENPGLPVHIARASGFEEAGPDMHSWHLKAGRYITASEHRSGAPVMMVSVAVAARLWPGAQAIDQTIRMGGQSVKVVGVVDVGKADATATVVPLVYLPLSLAQKLLGHDTLDQIQLRTQSVGVTSRVASDIKAGMRKLHDLPADTLDDFRVDTQSVTAMPSMGQDPRLSRSVHSNIVGFEQASWEEMAKSLRQAGRIFTLLLAGAAAVSLVVGGIGVMNIMLVSVAARTREIGLRMALGARMGDVLVQFLVEAVTLAALGGLIGLLLGWVGLLVAHYGLNWAAVVSPGMLVAAISMAAITGAVFGYGPARRAAQLDPVIALKSE